MKILMIEDNEDILEIAKDEGMVTAPDVKLGLALIETTRPDLVFCDYHGISKEGKTPEDVIRLCQKLNIKVVLTSSDEKITNKMKDLFNIEAISKLDAMTYHKEDKS